MLAARAGNLYVLGLSDENIRRLQQGSPIHVSNDTIQDFLPEGMKIMIFSGATEESMRRDLGDLIKKGHTKIIDDRGWGIKPREEG